MSTSRLSVHRCTCRASSTTVRHHGSLSRSSPSKAAAPSASPSSSSPSSASSTAQKRLFPWSPASPNAPTSRLRWPWDSLRTQHTTSTTSKNDIIPPNGSSRAAGSSRTQRPMRSLLYVPGSDPRKLKKSIESTSDVVILDLEDSVAENEKGRARSAVYDALQAILPSSSDSHEEEEGGERKRRGTFVRINSIEPLRTDDLEVVLQAETLDGIVIPKVDSPDHVKFVDDMIEQVVPPERKDKVKIVASIESPLALMNLKEIATSSKKIDALLFAAEDYCASAGISRTSSRHELAYARAAVVTAAKAYGLRAIDLVCIEYKDMSVLEHEALEGKQFGFDGKQAIHPAQVETIQRAFAPSEKQIERALGILEQYEKATKAGKGAYGFKEDGGGSTMIDAPMILQARSVIEQARAAGLPTRSRTTNTTNGNSNESNKSQ